MILKRLREFLDGHNVRYTLLTHSQAFTAEEISSIAHIPFREFAKTVIVMVDGNPIMAVVPGSDMVNLKLLKKSLGARNVELADEQFFKNLFPECETGAMPPFGNLYDIKTVVADDLMKDEQIAFNAGSHRELVRMALKDFNELVHPQILRISAKKKSREDDLQEPEI